MGAGKNSEDDIVMVEDAHDPIIEKEVFMKAQRILNGRRFKKEAPRVYHPLTGILFCGKCNQGMVCQKRSGNNKTYRYYICKTYHKYGRDYCTQANVNAGDLEEIIIDTLENKLRELYPKLEIESKLARKDLDTARIEKELKEIERKIEKINQDTADLYFDRDKMTEEQYAYVAKLLKDNAIRLRAHAQELEQELELKKENQKGSEEIMQYIEEFFIFDRTDIAKLRNLLHYFIERIDLTENHVDLTYRFEI